MTKLLTRRARFPFGDGVLVRGDVIETADYPTVDQHKWDQLVEHRYFDWSDRPRREMARANAELTRVRGFAGLDESGVPDASDDVGCAQCDFVAKTPHGLTVHHGRKHRAS